VLNSFTARVTCSIRQVNDKEETPELPQVVLQGRPRQDEAVGGVQLLHRPCHLYYKTSEWQEQAPELPQVVLQGQPRQDEGTFTSFFKDKG
jgi:hypothetical protein